MPKSMEQALMKVADRYIREGRMKKKAGESNKEAQDRFVYGRMRKTGWKPSREKK